MTDDRGRGEELLDEVMRERLQELDGVADEYQRIAAGSIYSFCSGAAEALHKAGLLTLQSRLAALDRLGEELEHRGLGERIRRELEATTEVVARGAPREEPE